MPEKRGGVRGVESNADYFQSVLIKETERLKDLCTHWRGVLHRIKDIPEDYIGDINVAIGQAELLINDRFAQFCGLVEDCRLMRGEKEITISDLQGFWDIIFFQEFFRYGHVQRLGLQGDYRCVWSASSWRPSKVEDVFRKFDCLDRMEKCDWQASRGYLGLSKVKPDDQRKKCIPKHPFPKKPKTASSSLHAHIQAARLKLKQEQEAKKKSSKSSEINKLCIDIEGATKESHMVAEKKTLANVADAEEETSPPITEKVVFDAGFFKVETPVKKGVTEKTYTPGKVEQRVLASRVLRERVQESPVVHKDYSPCMRVTRSMKAKMTNNMRRLNF